MPRRRVVVGLVSLAILAVAAVNLIPRLLRPRVAPAPAYWPTEGWRTGTPEEQGFDSSRLAEGLQALRDGNVRLDSLLIIRNGAVLLDAYFYPYAGTAVHDLASVSKSVMTTLIGIAADEGNLKLDQPMVSFFPERTIANRDARKERVTVRHLAGMVNGLQSGCMGRDEENLNAMRATGDWVQSALDRKATNEPGSRFCYDSPGMHLLSAILQQATGMGALDFARQYLFGPLGIRDVAWEADPQGVTRGWGDLHLRPLDAAKIGYLWLHSGVWDGRQIVSSTWVRDSVKAHSDLAGDDYGYGWWVSKDGYYASGRAGQNIRVYPELNVVVVTTCSGCDYSEVSPLLTAALVDRNRALPANPGGVARLAATVAALAKGPEPEPVATLFETARAVSGQTYAFEPNAANMATLGLEFGSGAEAILRLRRPGSEEIFSWPIGLDGVYRLSPEGQALRGGWTDSQTFVYEIQEITKTTFRLRFEADRVVIDCPELGIRFEGVTESP